MKKFNMVVALFLAIDVSGMEDSAMQYIKMKAAYPGCAELEADHREKLEEFAKDNPGVVFEKFYEIFASSAMCVPSCHTFALLSALGHICSSNAVDACVVNRICKHVAYLRASENVKCLDIKELIDVADGVISCIPYAGMTLCIYSPTRSCIPPETRQKTYDFVLHWMKKAESKNTAVAALREFMCCIASETAQSTIVAAQ